MAASAAPTFKLGQPEEQGAALLVGAWVCLWDLCLQRGRREGGEAARDLTGNGCSSIGESKTKGSPGQGIFLSVSRLHPRCLCNRNNFFLDVRTLPRFAQCLHVFLTEGLICVPLI